MKFVNSFGLSLQLDSTKELLQEFTFIYHSGATKVKNDIPKGIFTSS